MEKPPNPPLGALTKTLMAIYFASAALFSITLFWLLLRIVNGATADRIVVPHPPGPLLIVPCLVMLAAKVGAGWAYRRDTRGTR